MITAIVILSVLVAALLINALCQRHALNYLRELVNDQSRRIDCAMSNLGHTDKLLHGLAEELGVKPDYHATGWKKEAGK